jgi:hypothetical protein
MMSSRFIQYLNLPRVPDDILRQVPRDPAKYDQWINGVKNLETYKWSDQYNREVNAWCQENICAEMYFGFQMIFGCNEIHKDVGTLTKINYVIDTGGQSVMTNFFADDQQTVLASYEIEPHRWHIFKADAYHQVTGLDPALVRFSITGRIFP